MKQWVNNKIQRVKEYYIRPRRIALAYTMTIFFVLLFFLLYIGNLAEDRLFQQERARVPNRVNTLGTSLTLAVNQRLMTITSVHSFIEAKVSQRKKYWP